MLSLFIEEARKNLSAPHLYLVINVGTQLLSRKLRATHSIGKTPCMLSTRSSAKPHADWLSILSMWKLQGRLFTVEGTARRIVFLNRSLCMR
jgi:hypothetical protein